MSFLILQIYRWFIENLPFANSYIYFFKLNITPGSRDHIGTLPRKIHGSFMNRFTLFFLGR